VVGHADKRGAEDYNVALGMRRAKAVYDAIAAALPAERRAGLRVDVNEDPAAPAGMNGQ
jgi:outer membrane protein OmpA-like peptidoglycan-associated protein